MKSRGITLGWTLGRHFYLRQLRDMKIGALVDLFSPGMMTQYAEICGWAVARAHARSGAPAQISGYLDRSDAFDQAIAAFSIADADQSERDHATVKKAVRSGRVEVVMEPGLRLRRSLQAFLNGLYASRWLSCVAGPTDLCHLPPALHDRSLVRRRLDCGEKHT